MTPYEILLSESQERMLVVAKHGREDDVRGDSREVGSHRRRHRRGDRRAGVSRHRRRSRRRGVPRHRASSPIARATPRSARESTQIRALRARDVARDPGAPGGDAIRRGRSSDCSSSPTIASKAGSTGSTTRRCAPTPSIGPGGDAAVVRIRGTQQGARGQDRLQRPLRVPRSARGRPHRRRRGGAQRRVHRRAADGDHEQPQLRQSRRGPRSSSSSAKRSPAWARRARALGTPVTGGNVSLYNESPAGAVYPDAGDRHGRARSTTSTTSRASRFSDARRRDRLLGEPTGELGASEYLAAIHGVVAGAPPALRSRRASARSIDALLEAIRAGAVTLGARLQRRRSRRRARRVLHRRIASASSAPTIDLIALGRTPAARAAVRRGAGARRRVDADPAADARDRGRRTACRRA